MTWVKIIDELPPKSGIYPACSTKPGRAMPEYWVESLYEFNADAVPGECKWQHGSGFYDNGLTHWLRLSAPEL